MVGDQETEDTGQTRLNGACGRGRAQARVNFVRLKAKERGGFDARFSRMVTP
jgi:hypothetical protein